MWIICGVLLGIILLLLWKIGAMRKAAREIREGFAEKLDTETNTLIMIDSQDRTMRKLADGLNVELRRLRAQRRRYEQGNIALKETITNVSHDIRTPLTAIYGYLELLEKEEKSEAAEKYLEIIKNRTEALKELTEELFMYAAAVPAGEISNTINMTQVSFMEEKYEEVDLNRVLEESISAYYGALKMRQITPQITIPSKKVIRKLNPAALSRILDNVLNNAIKYSDGDLKVILSEDGEIEFANHAEALDEVQVGRLFEKFYTVESGEHATGLGLSIARLLTEQMGGSIRAQYKDGVLVIRVVFPEL
ncbi:MAG: HAMP domain-containing histidine kinase [Lachnospiraceae bacterium]|nr:HAMP domain-containing histidine kinase [Lachnospiraceae bacterium]